MKVEEYLESLERKYWREEEDLITHFKQVFAECVFDRKEWEKRARWGRQVQRYDFSFMDEYLGAKKPTTQVWGINFIATNIGYTIAAALAQDVEISLHSDNEGVSKAEQLLEAKLNFSVDKFRFLRKSDQALWDNEYTGMAYGRPGWNAKNQDGVWFNGKPDFRIILPEDAWVDPSIKAKDKSDCKLFIYREQYQTKNLRKISPELNKLVDDYYTNLDMQRKEGEQKVERRGIITAYHYLYERKFQMPRRAFVNEESPKVKWFYEKEWEETIKQITGKPEMEPEELEQYKKSGELLEESAILPEGIKTSKKIDSEVSYWFETLLIPDLNIVITEPYIVGKINPVSIMAGNYTPDSAYSFSNAWKMKSPLELSILNMTIQFFDTVKKNKPIIAILPGSILNENDVRDNWGSPNLTIEWNLKFLKDNYPHITKDDCLTVIKVPESGRMQILLDEKLQRAASESQVTPPVSKGEQPYAGMPAEGIARLQQAAAQGQKNSYIEYTEFILHNVEVLKELLIKHVNYKHKILTVTETGSRGMEDINTESDNMLSNAEDSIVKITMIENSEIMKSIKEQKLLLAYQTMDEYGKALILSDDLLRGLLPEDAERLSNNKKKFLEQNPQLLQNTLSGLNPVNGTDAEKLLTGQNKTEG